MVHAVLSDLRLRNYVQCFVQESANILGTARPLPTSTMIFRQSNRAHGIGRQFSIWLEVELFLFLFRL